MKLLFIEDEVRFFDWLQEYLPGHQCHNAPTLDDAAEILSREKFDAVFVDLKMPKHSPEEVVATTKAFADGTPVIVLTGNAMRSDLAGLCEGFIHKDALAPDNTNRVITDFVKDIKHTMNRESPMKQTAKLFAAYGLLPA